jgi:hypothetical protein
VFVDEVPERNKIFSV